MQLNDNLSILYRALRKCISNWGLLDLEKKKKLYFSFYIFLQPRVLKIVRRKDHDEIRQIGNVMELWIEILHSIEPLSETIRDYLEI